MGKSLVIVESPAKAKTINKYLGREFVVKSSVGHIRDLPTGGGASASDPKARAKAAAATRKMTPEQKEKHKKEKAQAALITRMGVDPLNGWKPRYEILPGKEKVIKELKTLAKDADTIYLATDLDREGEAIAWHLKETIGGEDSRFQRVVFNEITKKAIQSAFAKPGQLDMNHVNAQQARRFLDRIVGFMVSPLLWKKVARGLSAGRVQSVAVRLIVEREREIRAFIPEEYWEIFADTTTQEAQALRLQVTKEKGEAFKSNSKASTDKALSVLQKSQYEVVKREDKPTSSKPSAPFITSTLQQAASTRMGFGVKKTMMLAQRLYEAGYITYMRTDSTNLSADAIEMARGYIQKEFGDKYLPDNPIQYSNKEGAQEAHEAIRPSSATVLPDQLTNQDKDAVRLYDLIWRQFLACQMVPARYDSTSISVKAGEFELRTRGRILKFDGWTRALPIAKRKDEDVVLPDVKVGQVLTLKKLDPKQNFTKPTARFTEASLVKELEKRGIGRPSTYASIISTIQERGYVSTQGRRFFAEKMGEIVTDRLLESFSDLMDYGFTAGMEESLDEIAKGQVDWKHELDTFYGQFTNNLDKAELAVPEGGMRSNEPVMTDIECPACSRPMTIRTASTGVFLGCSGYALPPKERCKKTLNLLPGEEAISDNDDEEKENELLRAKKRCHICGTAMESYLIDETRKIHVCGNNPDCGGYQIEEGSFKIKGYEGPIIICDKCGSDMQLKAGRFGKYFGCTNEACKNTRKLLKNGEPAPPKADPIPLPHLACQKVDDHYVLRDGASGIFLAASQFPKNRETRAPFVDEIADLKEQLDPKLKYLADAPQKDSQNNRTVIRYSRKTKSQYVMSEVEGKATGWVAHYNDGKWVVDASKMKKATSAAKKSPKDTMNS
ncbi:MAG: type I DNA topoisomerase [Pseudomonadota bacterium]